VILELARTDLARLVHGEDVELDGLTVRLTDTASAVLDVRAPAPDRTAQVSERRSEARANLTGDPQFYMRAKFDGVCNSQYVGGPAPDCTQTIAAGDRVLRDRANGKTYCAPCGAVKYPNVRGSR
jgi:hypothetical protein